MANHNDQLFILYADKSTNVLYYAKGNNDSFATLVTFLDVNKNTYTVTAPIALCSAYEKLYAIIVQANGLNHFIYDDLNQVWDSQSVFAPDDNLPALCQFNSDLFLAMVAKKGNAVLFTTWNDDSVKISDKIFRILLRLLIFVVF